MKYVMKIKILPLSIVMLLTSCMQQRMPEPVFYKTPSGNKSVAVPISSSTIKVNALGNSVTDSRFLESLKSELRKKNWRLVVQGVTGRSGEHNSINSGSTYTLACEEVADVSMQGVLTMFIGFPFWIAKGCPPIHTAAYVNCVLIENKTGEEVMSIRGRTENAHTLAKRVAERMEEKLSANKKQ